MIIDSPIISGSYAATGSLNQVGNVTITGSLTVTGPITGALTGSVDSASFATTASYVSPNTQINTASFATTASYARTVDFNNTVVTSSYSLTASYVSPTTPIDTASFAITASYVSPNTQINTASFAITASYVSPNTQINTSSYALNAELLDGLDSSVFTPTGSFNSYTASNNSTVTSVAASTALALASIATLTSKTGSYTLTSSFNSYTSSNDANVNCVSSMATAALVGVAALASRTGSYATTGSNTFAGGQYFSSSFNPTGFTTTASLYTDGGLRVTRDAYISGTLYLNNLTVFGTQSVAYISSSQLNIGTNIITVNTDTPSVRFGGLAVYDSGSTGLTGSILWDSQDNQWIYSNPTGSEYDSAVFLVGPRNSGVLGNEPGISCNFLSKGNGMHHMTSSGIFEDGSRTCFYNSGFITSTGVSCFTTSCAASIVGGTVSGTTGNFSSCITAGARSFITGTAGYLFDVQTTDTNKPRFQVYIDDTNGVDLISGYDTTAKNLRFSTGGNIRANITSAGIACFACQVCAPSFISSGTICATGNTCFGGMSVIANCLGIGTAAPTEKLEVRGTIAGCNIARFTDGNYGDLVISFPSSGVSSIDSYLGIGHGALAFRTCTTERARITSTGIACFACQVCAPQLRLAGSTNIIVNPSFIGSSNLRNGGAIQYTKNFTIFTDDGANGCGFDLQYYNGSSYYPALRINNVASGFSNLLLMQDGGNVGIGNTSPVVKLDIQSCSSGTGLGDGMILKLKNTSTTTDTRSGITFGNIDGIGGSLAMQSAILKSAATGEYDMTWDVYGGAAGWQEGILYIDSNPGTVAIGTAGSQTTSTYTGRLSIHKVGSGANIVLGTGCNTNNAVISRFVTYNSNNGNSGNEGATQFYGITSIESALTTSNSNASGNSGGYLMFKTKGDAGTLDERMRITSGGNVVIGNTVASNVGLTIYGSNAATIYQTANTGTGAANGFYVGHTGDVSYIWNYNNYPTVFATNNTERMRITSGGNVGIGASTAPVYKLEVSSTGGSERIRVGTLQNNDNTPRFEAITSNGVSVANSAWLRVNDAGGFTLGQSDYTKAGGDSGNFSCLSSEVEYPRITVSSGGYVGIGITSPNERLDVSGAVQVRGESLGYATTQCVGMLDFYANTTRILSFGGNSTTCGCFRFYSAAQNNAGGNDVVIISGGGAACFRGTICTGGHIIPTSNGTQDLGSSSLRWCTVYTSDLSLNNGIGNYTIVEGESDLFLYNNNSCKVFKFLLQEVCPEIAPAKRST